MFVALKNVAPKNEKFGRDVVAQSQICKLWRLDRPLVLSQKILSKKSNYIIKLSSKLLKSDLSRCDDLIGLNLIIIVLLVK